MIDLIPRTGISLLCSDYKILSKVLTNRLKLVISSVISNAQSCGVPGRFSGESVSMLQDIVDYANLNDIGAAPFCHWIKRKRLIVLIGHLDAESVGAYALWSSFSVLGSSIVFGYFLTGLGQWFYW
jgi:hypothetical protein